MTTDRTDRMDPQADAPPDPQRRRLLQVAGSSMLGAWLLRAWPATATSATATWPQWRSFVARHVQHDGRVIDFLTPDLRSTSEGQSYALFFALCDNDHALFERLLEWTRNQLCMGYMDQRLPAWLWGKAKDGSWKVLDDASASDSDLWIIYVLLEAARLWKRPDYERIALRMIDMVKAHELPFVPGLGRTLLPGSVGFTLPDGHWRLNPSYLPVQLLRRLALARSHGPWEALAEQTPRIIGGSAPNGFVPDWIVWDGKRFVDDPQHGSVGSYDAIRAYLWAGMLAPDEPLRAPLLKAMNGPLGLLQSDGKLFEKIDVRTAARSGQAPVGYAGAMLPYLQAQGQDKLLATQLHRIRDAIDPAGKTQLPYYERVLILFGQGWLEKRFRFARDGRLLPSWENA